MNKATKAALFCALLFPGWGQFYLKRYKRGLIFLVPVLAGSLALAWWMIVAAAAIIRATPFQRGTIQLANVIQVALDTLKAIDLNSFLLVIMIISVIWILSIIDAYQLGKKMNEATTHEYRESASDQK